ncbi:MAG: SHOCT domain-containing protein [Actinobacteria bacterium]|nr:SHOCT domain-containing protein [Actinomycetota bacterium]
MTKKRFLSVGPGAPSLSDHDMAQLDRRHPELSFTGQVATTDPDRPPPTAPADDLVDRLERLRGLHAEGVLTEDEFAVAKARLLGRG